MQMVVYQTRARLASQGGKKNIGFFLLGKNKGAQVRPPAMSDPRPPPSSRKVLEHVASSPTTLISSPVW